MGIDLKKFFLSDDLSETMECEFDLSGVELGGVKPFCAPVKGKVTLESFAGSVLLCAHVTYEVTMPCDRCFEMASQVYSRDFSHTLVRERNREDDDDYILVSEERLDLDSLIQEDILLDMPTKFLCSPDCKGLCPVCGKNLNEGDCGCDTRQVDPRLEILKELL